MRANGRSRAATDPGTDAPIGPGVPRDHPQTDPAHPGGNQEPHKRIAHHARPTPMQADQPQPQARASKRQRWRRTRSCGRSSGCLGAPSWAPMPAGPAPPSPVATIVFERRNLIITARERASMWVSTGVKGRFGRWVPGLRGGCGPSESAGRWWPVRLCWGVSRMGNRAGGDSEKGHSASPQDGLAERLRRRHTR